MWDEDDEEEVEIKDRPLMAIPLPLHLYRLAGIGEAIPSSWARWNEPEPSRVSYRLVDTVIPIVEGDHVPGRLNRSYAVDYIKGLGVCIIVPDHSFGRGLVRLVLGWSVLVTIPDEEANDFERVMRTHGHGAYVRSRMHNEPVTAFNLEDDRDLEHAVAFKMRLDGVGIHHSKLPLMPGDFF